MRNNMGKVLQKYIAESGYCSRRKAEEWIKEGEVFVNGEVAEPGTKVDEKDEVKIFGEVIGLAEEKIYIKMNKPVGYVCTTRQFKGEKNIFDLIGKKERLFVAGRLDKDSRGLILPTNDGDLAQKITHPSFSHEKKYRIKLCSSVLNPEIIANRLKSGIDIGDGDGIVKAKGAKALSAWEFEMTLGEGKKRQIRRMFMAFGLKVKDLIRVSVSTLELGDLPEGQWRPLKKKEIEEIKK
jgi:pseudouridine synthase